MRRDLSYQRADAEYVGTVCAILVGLAIGIVASFLVLVR